MVEFDINKTASYWFKGAKYNLSVANVMLKSKKYPYAIFMGHLALEKLLKALVVKYTEAHAPFSHSLPYLTEKSGIKAPEEILVKLSLRQQLFSSCHSRTSGNPETVMMAMDSCFRRNDTGITKL